MCEQLRTNCNEWINMKITIRIQWDKKKAPLESFPLVINCWRLMKLFSIRKMKSLIVFASVSVGSQTLLATELCAWSTWIKNYSTVYMKWPLSLSISLEFFFAIFLFTPFFVLFLFLSIPQFSHSLSLFLPQLHRLPFWVSHAFFLFSLFRKLSFYIYLFSTRPFLFHSLFSWYSLSLLFYLSYSSLYFKCQPLTMCLFVSTRRLPSVIRNFISANVSNNHFCFICASSTHIQNVRITQCAAFTILSVSFSLPLSTPVSLAES